VGIPDLLEDSPFLPCWTDDGKRNFVEAGIFVRGTPRYYALFGASNGGVLKVFDRRKRRAIWNDSGYVGETSTGKFVTTQVTDQGQLSRLTDEEISSETDFCLLSHPSPSPILFLMLRLMNLTFMRSIRLGNWIKKRLVQFLMNKKRSLPLKLTRTVKFGVKTVTVVDRIQGSLQLRWLEYGRPFVAIHMASARYFEGTAGASAWLPRRIDVIALHRSGEFECQVEI